ncbi:mRNA cap guanine-N7 methyltransferase [Trichinella papuae]|uniref:mRNA cap guanine-N(7) methyltransferase n=2 Tax=Trichinella papuae TaxID=268474 RepID=A0A0V1M842_9BILA|nr:mRNA cap guanine-N7 methyltransferase [Trichinella papuae]
MKMFSVLANSSVKLEKRVVLFCLFYLISMNNSEIAEHYNRIPNSSRKDREKSRILHLRRLNNWIKSILIHEALHKVKSERDRGGKIRVLDLCCGKGGDLQKWKFGKIDQLTAVDIAQVSVSHCKERYSTLFTDEAQYGYFKAEFLCLDCSKEDLRKHLAEPDVQFDLCSCQFSLHYAFANLQQAERMLQNACQNLKIGGYFIGTIPDANFIVSQCRSSADGRFRNSVCQIQMQNSTHDGPLPLFGANYDFQLEGVVNCYEYLIYFPLLEKMLQELGMVLVWKKKFYEIIDTFLPQPEHRALFERMDCLEIYSEADIHKMAGSSLGQYDAARRTFRKLQKEKDAHQANHSNIGTISQDEWEVACLYLTFMFKKIE